MLQEFLAPAYTPFTFALSLLFGLFCLELFAALLGGSILAGGEDGADVGDIDSPEFDLDVDPDLDLDGLDLSDLDVDAADLEAPEAVSADADATSVLAWLGLGRVPFMIWLASTLLGFGLSGVGLQTLTQSLVGYVWPAWIVAIPAAAIGLGFARRFGQLFSRLVPKTETQAISERSYNRRRGIISQGTARRGHPAEVRITDGYGNAHYLRAEPLRDEVEIPKGSEVIVVRRKRERGYVLVPLGTSA